MRIKTELSERPPVFTVNREGDRAVIIFYTDVQEVQREDGSSAWEAVSWTIESSWTDNIIDRITEDPAAWLAEAQAEAYTEAAAKVRSLRDKLLTESDAMTALDRFGMDLPDKVTATTMLSVFKEILTAVWKITNGSIGQYRQALRDLPEQPGFPFDIDWPNKPE